MVAYAGGRLKDAEACMQAALRVFSSIGAPLETSRILLALAEVATARGQADAAARHLNDARAALMAPALTAYREEIWWTVGPEWSRTMRALRDLGA